MIAVDLAILIGIRMGNTPDETLRLHGKSLTKLCKDRKIYGYNGMAS